MELPLLGLAFQKAHKVELLLDDKAKQNMCTAYPQKCCA